MTALITIPVRSKRDLLLARQRARQIAALLHFEPADQACIAAGTFAVAHDALGRVGPCTLSIRLADQSLHVSAGAERPDETGESENQGLRLVKPLPAMARAFAPEDLAWMLDQLTQHSPFRVFEEIHRQNQEMLVLLHALRTATAQQPGAADQSVHTDAA